jgi:hypothetical protein
LGAIICAKEPAGIVPVTAAPTNSTDPSRGAWDMAAPPEGIILDPHQDAGS